MTLFENRDFTVEESLIVLKIINRIDARTAYLHKIAMMKSWEAPEHDRGSRNELAALRDWIVTDLQIRDLSDA